MDVEQSQQIKKLAIIAMFSDDDLMDLLVLKGGNAIDLIYGVTSRSSIDTDFSIEQEFNRKELEVIQSKIQKVIQNTFREAGYEVFDIKFEEKPRKTHSEIADFWGGYRIQFKVIEKQRFKQLFNNQRVLRTSALPVGKGQKRTFTIEISKFEYCTLKRESDLEGYTIYVYTPEMIVIEKIRSICQQMPEYATKIKSHTRSARARDFFDIYTLIEHFKIDFADKKNIELFKNIFNAKRVPLRLIEKIHQYKEYHRPDFEAVKNTVKPGIKLKDFDFYFDYVVHKCHTLKSLRII